MPRCGTNFLSNLLLLHPDCAAPDPVWEDFLVTHLDLLAGYGDAVSGRWDSSWGVDSGTRKSLDTSLGDGVVRFLNGQAGAKRAISKTPEVHNMDLFFRFFPDARLLIMVRDGRSIVESSIRSFAWRREPALHAIEKAASTIRRFMQSACDCEGRYRLVRYEDLWEDTEAQLCDLLTFLGLDRDRYDMEQALNLPVRGSSDLKATGTGQVHWDPVERTEDFDPMSRFDHWGPGRHYRYNQVAGTEMEALGYRKQEVGDPSGLLRLRGLALNTVWGLKSLLRPLYHRYFRP